MIQVEIRLKSESPVFTGKIRNGENFAIGMKKHTPSSLVWISHQLRIAIDSAIAEKENKHNILSQDDFQSLFQLSVVGLIDFVVDGVLFSFKENFLTFKTIQDSYTDAERLYHILYKTLTPFTAKVEITNKCNFKCMYCYVKGRDDLIFLSEWKTVLVKLREIGVIYLEITGGEPTFHKDFWNIIEEADRLGFDTTVCTNGFYIDELFSRRISTFRAVDVRVSFHSIDENVFDVFVGRNGAMKRIILNLNFLFKSKAKFSVYIVATSHNEKTLLDTVDFLNSSMYDFSVSVRILPSQFGDENMINYHASKTFVDELIDRGLSKKRVAVCSALATKLWVSANGDVFPCELMRTEKIGNLFSEDFHQFWNSLLAKKIRKSVEKYYSHCSKCSDLAICGPCPVTCSVFKKNKYISL